TAGRETCSRSEGFAGAAPLVIIEGDLCLLTVLRRLFERMGHRAIAVSRRGARRALTLTLAALANVAFPTLPARWASRSETYRRPTKTLAGGVANHLQRCPKNSN